MTHPVSLLGAVALGIVLASSSAEAQTIHHRARHPADAGHQITVHARESWLTAGAGATVGSRHAYVLDTLRPPLRTSNEGTFVGVRGLERLPNQYSLPQSNRPLIIVSWPGSTEPLFSLY
ncbi:MAG: hypothetical protein ACREDI_02985 [Roseiarcus sp.]